MIPDNERLPFQQGKFRHIPLNPEINHPVQKENFETIPKPGQERSFPNHPAISQAYIRLSRAIRIWRDTAPREVRPLHNPGWSHKPDISPTGWSGFAAPGYNSPRLP
jgi:hypothetical protein